LGREGKRFRACKMKKPFKASKFHSIKSGGYMSRKEHKRALELKQMAKAGIITDLQEQVPFELLPKQEVIGFNGKMMCGRRSMKYIADFVYIENGVQVVEDSKGFRTPEYKRKRNLMLKIHGITIKET
jgi:hypothetical protein